MQLEVSSLANLGRNQDRSFFRMERSTRGSGQASARRGMVSRCGRTAQDMKVFGIKTKHAERVNSTMLMAMFMTVTGLTTRLTVRALITIAVEPFFVVSGVMTSSMVQGKRPTLMGPYT